MTFYSNVAPKRKVKPKPANWWCGCRSQPAHMTRCAGCGRKRP